jgi:CBS-domain-containing membrane protein
MGWSIADVMTKDVVVATPETGFKKCVDLMRLHGVSALPVVNNGGCLLGILSEADLLVKEEERGARPPAIDLARRRRRLAAGRNAGDMMTSPAVAVGPGATVSQAARLMHAKRVKRLPVVDAQGRLIGIVSRADLLKTFLRSDEAIRRDIADKVLRGTLSVDPKTIEVQVTDGLVSLRGELESRSLADLVVRYVANVEGTIAVDSKITYRLDDSGLRLDHPPRALQLSAQERK